MKAPTEIAVSATTNRVFSITLFRIESFSDSEHLLSYDTASNTWPGVACWIRFVIVGIRVNHQRRAALMKQRVWSAPEGSVRVQERSFTDSISIHLKIKQVSGVRTLRVVFPVFFGGRVEM